MAGPVKPYKLGLLNSGVAQDLVDWASDDFLDLTNGGLGASCATKQQACNAIEAQWTQQKNVANGYAGLDSSGLVAKAQLPSVTVYTDAANSFLAGLKQSFTHSATTAGFRLVPAAGDPSTPANGDVWYLSGTGIRYREEGATKTLSSAGGGSTTPGGSNTHVQFNNAGAFGGADTFLRNVHDGTEVRIVIGSATDHGSLRLTPKSGDITNAVNGELWADANGNIRAKQNGVVSGLGIAYDSVGLFPTASMRPREWDRNRMFMQAVPGEENYSHYGMSSVLSSLGTVNQIYLPSGCYNFHTSLNAVLAGAGLQAGHSEFVQAQWAPNIYIRFYTDSSFPAGSVIWLGLFGDNLLAIPDPANPTTLPVIGLKAAGSALSSYTCSGTSTNVTVNSIGTLLASTAYECFIRYNGANVEFWFGVVGAGMTLVQTHSTNVPSGDAWMAPSMHNTSTGSVVGLGLNRFLLEFN